MSKVFNRVMKVWLVITFLILFIPIISIVVMSFNTSRFGTFPFKFTLHWYEQLFSGSTLVSSVWYSLWFSVLVSAMAAVFGAMASLALRRLSVRTNKVFPTLSNIPVIIPWLVQAVALLLLFNMLGIGRSFVSMFFGNLVTVLPHSFLLTYSRVMTMDRFPEEAARTLGARGLAVFKDVTLPMIFPAVLAGWLMSLVLCFNNFPLQYYLAPFGTYTLPMRIFTMIRVGYEPDINAIATLMSIATLIVIFILHRIGFTADQLVGRSKTGE
jgi:spermidine/putrescine transport system permease protein